MAKLPTDEKIARASTVFVNRTISKNGERPEDPETSGEEQVLAVHEFVTQPASVGVTVALTMNLGNYESARISVSLNMPCYKEEIDPTFSFVQKWVEQKVAHERELIDAYRNKSGKINPL